MTPTVRGSSVFLSSYKNTILSQSAYVFSLSCFLKGGKSTRQPTMAEHVLVFMYFDSQPWKTKNYTKVFFKTIFYLTLLSRRSQVHNPLYMIPSFNKLRHKTHCYWLPMLQFSTLHLSSNNTSKAKTFDYTKNTEYTSLNRIAATSFDKLTQCRKVLGLAPCMKSFCGYTKILANSLEHGYAKSFHVSFLMHVAQV